jgi:hypothetical protein
VLPMALAIVYLKINMRNGLQTSIALEVCSKFGCIALKKYKCILLLLLRNSREENCSLLVVLRSTH